MNSKETIRVSIQEQRNKLAPEWILKISDQIQGRVLELDEWKAANQVCCYLALPCEVQTGRLVKTAWNAEKKVCVPVFRKENGCYDLAWLNEAEHLTVGYGHVPEPSEPSWINDAPGPVEQSKVDLVVTPGVAFGRSGARIGHGRGHYDRLLVLKALKGAIKLGLAFEFQMLNQTPSQGHDVRMDAVVTEKNVYRRNR